jgi:hypothetical protein
VFRPGSRADGALTCISRGCALLAAPLVGVIFGASLANAAPALVGRRGLIPTLSTARRTSLRGGRRGGAALERGASCRHDRRRADPGPGSTGAAMSVAASEPRSAAAPAGGVTSTSLRSRAIDKSNLALANQLPDFVARRHSCVDPSNRCAVQSASRERPRARGEPLPPPRCIVRRSTIAPASAPGSRTDATARPDCVRE